MRIGEVPSDAMPGRLIRHPSGRRRLPGVGEKRPAPSPAELGLPRCRGTNVLHDSLLEGGVSCELVSENAKFPASRENTGNFIDSGLGGASMMAKKAINSVSYEPIPYAPEQGIF